MSVKMSVKYIVRQMQVSDFEEVRQLWTVLNFMASKYDNHVMVKVDPQGLFVAQDLNTGQILGSISGINLSPDFAFIGQYGVRPEHQNLGIGSELWRTAMEHMGKDRNLGLYARGGPMSDKYRERCNFVVIPGRKAMCFTGKVDSSQLIKAIDGISVVPLTEDNIDKVIQYDKQVYNGFDRTVLIRENAKYSEYANKVALSPTNEVLGYCMLKVSNHKTGLVEPLYANDEKIAELLFAKCYESLRIAQTNGVIWSCTDANLKSIAFAKRLGLEVTRASPIHFTKNLVDGDYDRIFCISSRCFYPF